LKKGIFKDLLLLKESSVITDIEIEFCLQADNDSFGSKKDLSPAFLDRHTNILYYNSAIRKSNHSEIIKVNLSQVLAKYLTKNYKDLADWIELVLGSSDIERIKRKVWNVPREINDLFNEKKSSSLLDKEPLEESITSTITPAIEHIENDDASVESAVVFCDDQKQAENSENYKDMPKNPMTVIDVLLATAHVTKNKADKPESKAIQHENPIGIDEKVPVIPDTTIFNYIALLEAAFTQNGSTELNEDVISQLDNIKKKYNNKLISKCISQCKKELIKQNEKIERKGEKQKERNERIFRKIIKNKNMLNDFQYFAKLDVVQQKSIIKKIREINQYEKFDKPYRLSLIESDIPAVYKVAAMKKMAILRNMDPSNGEYYKIKNWVDTFMRIPFGKVDTLPIHFSDGVEKCHEFMENAQKTLDAAVYGLNDTKMQIMQILGQLITNPSSIGTAIAIHGPPGSGKTSLVKEGISKILNRPFAFIALGGATDSSFLEGHSYTYEGSVWGKIVQILIESKSMNPVIYFDELDKISDTPKGEEIASILTHLTDTTQNSQFHDKYFSEIDFDLSKCIFIFSYNDESKVNPILKDRMYRIKTKGYDLKQKTIISNQYLLPNIRKQVVFEEGQVIIQDDALHHIIENHCCNEDGVRNLKRCMEIIYTKLNLYRLMKPGENLFETDLALKVTFPFQVTKEIVDKLIKREEGNMTYRNLYV